MDPPFRHSASRAFISSAELSMKQGAAAAPEGRARFQKVSLVSRRLESTGSARGRDGSPSRVSLLLQAWEREIVEKKSGSNPATPTHREHSSPVSLLKDFTAHGPIFSQVYSPAQRPRRQDERGKGGPGGAGGPCPAGSPREVPVHRESYVHGTLLPTRPAERPAGAPGAGPGAPSTAKPGCAPAVPRARQVTVLRTGRDAAGPAEGREAPNGTHDTAGATAATAASPQRGGSRRDGSGSAVAAEGRESSPGTGEAAGPPAEGSPEEKDSPQAEATAVNATPGAGDRPGDPQTSLTSSPQWPSAGAGGQADPAGAGEGSVADVDGTISATPPRTENPPGAGSTPENPSAEVSDGPEPSSKTAASPKAEMGSEGDETMEVPQGTAPEPESIPEPPAEPPAPDPPAESPPDATEEDPELLVDMEIFVDTLRNMEPSEMRKAPKAPRQPRPSALGRCAALPPIHEDRVVPRAPVSLPEALRELLTLRGPAGRPGESPEEEEEIENPYLSPEERAGTLRAGPRDGGAGDGWLEGGSLLGTLGTEEKARLVAGGPAERSVLFRGNVLKGVALLSHFMEQRAAGAEEGKPYSRLDKSVLYSRFVAPGTALIELPDGDGGSDSPSLGDHNGLGPGGHSGPEMAVLEALSCGSVPSVAEEPESTVTLCPERVLVSESNTRPGKRSPFPGVWAGVGLNPGASSLSQHTACASRQRDDGVEMQLSG